MMVAAGDARNDIYVTLESGSFDKGTKRAERNVEVAINVVDNTGHVIPVSTQPLHSHPHSSLLTPHSSPHHIPPSPEVHHARGGGGSHQRIPVLHLLPQQQPQVE